MVPLFLFLNKAFLPNLPLTHGPFLILFTILNLCILLPAILSVPILSLLFQPFLLILQPPFLTLILFSLPYLTLLELVQIVFLEGGSPEVGQEDGVGATPTIPPENLIPKFLTLMCTSPFSNIAFSSSNAPWSGHFIYFCPDDPINLSTRPRIVNYTPEGSSINPFLKSDLSQPKIFSPMVTFNEHVRDMFTIVYSCNFLPGGDHKLTLSIHIKK